MKGRGPKNKLVLRKQNRMVSVSGTTVLSSCREAFKAVEEHRSPRQSGPSVHRFLPRGKEIEGSLERERVVSVMHRARSQSHKNNELMFLKFRYFAM